MVKVTTKKIMGKYTKIRIPFYFRLRRKFCEARSDSADEKSIILTKKVEKDLIQHDNKRVLATPVKFPFLPGMKSVQKLRDNGFGKGKRELAFFLSKNVNEKQIKSLDDIYTVGTAGYSSAFLGVVSNGPVVNPNYYEKQLFNEMVSLKTVKALSFDNGYVVIKDHGSPLISKLHFSQMDQNMQDVFIAIKNNVIEENLNRIRNFLDQPTFFVSRSIETIEQLRSIIGILFPYYSKEMQNVLEREEPMDVLDELSKLLIKYKTNAEVMKKTSQRILDQVVQNERKMFLREQLDVINKELEPEIEFEADNKNEEINPQWPKEVREIIMKQRKRLKTMMPHNHEMEGVKAHLEWLENYPWGIKSKDNFDIKKAAKILDEDHYGLKKVKERILEHIATGKLSQNLAKGKILCLVGPPGVGKTSVGKSIARALDKKFVTLSLGGISDPHDIKGHRRTYIGALPGRIVTLMKKAGTVNPLLMIDEIDKIGRDNLRGDLSATLLDIFDSSQNNKFVDTFMEVEMNLSDVLFVCTANSVSKILPPLADRMEFIRLEGYTPDEKIKIAEKYLLPKTLKECGLTKSQADISTDALRHVIRWYSREPGVRGLERNIAKCLRKVALGIVEEKFKSKIVEVKDVKGLLGVEAFSKDRLFDETPVGVALGLSVTEMGGSALYVETTVTGEKKNDAKAFNATGQLGSVISESISIAFTVAERLLRRCASSAEGEGLQPPSARSFLAENVVHVHFPEGAVKKDGPSAGVTLICALVSLATKTKVKKDLAMTGEIMLSGKVLPVGGIKDKMLAAIQSNVKEVILPEDNKGDWEELEDEIKKKLTARFVESVEQVAAVAFPDISFEE